MARTTRHLGGSIRTCLEFDLDGEINMKCPLLVSLASDVYALKALSQHRQGNIIMSAWHKLGYVSAEELAKLRFDGDMEDAFAASMSHVQGSMRRLLNLDVLPDLGLDAAAKDLDSSILATALQAKRHVWWIHDEADRCLPLPSWTNRPLELVIMAWVKERQGWDRLLQERGDKGFTAQQQAKYAGVLLDMELQMGASQAKKGIIMLSLSLSMVPEELRICWKPGGPSGGLRHPRVRANQAGVARSTLASRSLGAGATSSGGG